jgi:DNA-binding HxlR family transcriptional regulator
MQKTYEQMIRCHCASANTMALIGGKWKIIILDHLRDGTQHFNELQRSIAGITPHTLSQNLKELVSDGLVSRQDFKTTPPSTAYSLDTLGKELLPILTAITTFGENHPLIE